MEDIFELYNGLPGRKGEKEDCPPTSHSENRRIKL